METCSYVPNYGSSAGGGECELESCEKCLICQRESYCCGKSSDALNNWSSSPELLGKDLQVYFILKHVLELPSEQLQHYLRHCPCPEKWVKVCGSCAENYVDKCRRIFLELMEVKRRFKEARMQLIGAIKKSVEAGVQAERDEDIILDICKETRHFVAQNEYHDGVNPFIAGDLLAKEKLIDNKRKRINPTILSFPPRGTAPTVENAEAASISVKEEQRVEVKLETNCYLDGEDAHHEIDPFSVADFTPVVNETKGINETENAMKEETRNKKGGECVINFDRNEDDDSMKINSDDDSGDADWVADNFSDSEPEPEENPTRVTLNSTANERRTASNKKSKLRRKNHDPLLKSPPYDCQICGETFTLKCALKRHIVAQHELDGKKPFQCDFCPSSFARKDNLGKHLKTVHKDGATGGTTRKTIINPPRVRARFKCTECGLSFAFRNVLLRHTKKMHGGRANSRLLSGKEKQCEKCSKVFTTKHQLRLHRMRVHNTSFYYCNACEYKTVTVSQLNNHQKLHHSNQEDLEDTTCSICQAILTSKYNLKVHMNQYHKEHKEAFPCEHCGKIYSKKSVLLTHIGTAHGIKDQLRFHCTVEGCGQSFYLNYQLKNHQDLHNAPHYACEECGKLVRTRKLLKRHMVTQHFRDGKKPYICDLCPARYGRKDNLARHIKVKHNPEDSGSDVKPSRGYLCAECGKGFVNDQCLRRHVDKVHNEKSKLVKTEEVEGFSCPICGRVLSSKRSLERHTEEVHEKKKQVCCELCGKILANPNHIKMHMFRVHKIGNIQLPEIPCSVEGCLKTFECKGHMEKHVLIAHEGQRPHQCDLCEKAFTSSTHLSRHIQALHTTNRESKPFKCDLCGKGFAGKNYLASHMKFHLPKGRKS